jgi:hypothetical protein
MSVLRITPTDGPILRISPNDAPSLKLVASGGPVLHLTSVEYGPMHARGVSGFIGGSPLPKPGGEWLGGGEAPYDFVVTPVGLSAKAKTPAVIQQTLTVFKDDDLLGYLVFDPGAYEAVSMVVSGVVQRRQFVGVRGPVVPDGSLADIEYLITEGDE